MTASRTAVLDHVRAPKAVARRKDPQGSPPVLVEVRLLGDFELRMDGRAVPAGQWSRRHSAALVKLLALTPGRSLHREQVLDALWPDLGIDEAAPRLHKAAHYARKVTGHRHAVVLSGDTVRLYPHDEVRVDTTRFQDAALTALRLGDKASAKAALTLFRGDLLPHDLYESWSVHHRRRFGDLYTALLHQAEDWHQALAADPADETAHLALAQRYADGGDRAAALRQLDRLDQTVHLDLGLAPSESSVVLRQQLLADTAASASGGDAPCCVQHPATVVRSQCDAP